MPKKLVYISISLVLAVFILSSGVITHGQNSGGGVYDHATGSRQKLTSYVKSGEQTTGVTEAEMAAEAAAQTSAAAEPVKVSAEEEKAAETYDAKSAFSDADYMKAMPSDFNVNLPPPTPQEMSANLAKAVKAAAASPAGSPGSKSIGLRLLAASYHYLGLPYKLGGNGITSTDCSMFTRMSAIRAKLEPKSFQRGAGNQYRYAEKKQFNMRLIRTGTDLSDLQPGDFVFFDWKNSFCAVRYHGVGHVGFYIGPTKGKAIYTIEAGDPVHKHWRNTKYLHGHARIVKG